MTDVHANLPALEAALADMQVQGVEWVCHGGDAVGIGPYPKEVMERLLELEKPSSMNSSGFSLGLLNIMGNHDAWYAFGLPKPQDLKIHPNEVRHTAWVHQAIGDNDCQKVAQWPYRHTLEVNGLRLGFAHYGLMPEPDSDGHPLFCHFIKDPSPTDLDELFSRFEVDIVLYGHHHPASDIQGIRARYVNPGALGCSSTPHARYTLLDVAPDGSYTLETRSPTYDDAVLQAAFDNRAVPEREFIRKAFFLGHFEG